MPEINNVLMALRSTFYVVSTVSLLERERSGRGTPLEHLSDMEMILGLGGGKLGQLGLSGWVISTDNDVVFFFFLRIFFWVVFSGINYGVCTPYTSYTEYHLISAGVLEVHM